MMLLGRCLRGGLVRYGKRSYTNRFIQKNEFSSASASSTLILRASTSSSISSSLVSPLSSSFSTATSAATTSSNPLSLYSWGTDHGGALLLSSSSILSSGTNEKKADIPVKVGDWKEQILNANDSYGSKDEVEIQSISCGPTDTALVLTNGDCYVVGKNAHGQLGLGHKDPVPHLTLLARNVQEIDVGEKFSAYITNEGDLHTFGFGGSAFRGMGCLGHGDGESYLEPKCVVSLIEDGCYAKQIQVGHSHLTVLTTEGEVLTCGAGSYGRLGNFDTVDQLYLEPVEMLSTGVSKISGGKSYTLALTDSGALYGWGRNDKCQIGTGYGLAVDMYAMEAIPAMIETDELMGREIIDVDAGTYHAAAITKGGELFIWGMSLHLEPIRVNELLHTQVDKVSCGQNYTLALTSDGQLYSFGKGKTGVLGQGPSVKNLNQPQLIETLEDYKVKDVITGYEHVFCFVDEGDEASQK